MKTVVSVRVPLSLEQAIRSNAIRSSMRVSKIVALILEHACFGCFSLSGLPDARDFLDAKLDIRVPDSLVLKLQAESQRLRVSGSVYIRKVLTAYYMKRLVFVERDGHYTLEENNDETKRA